MKRICVRSIKTDEHISSGELAGEESLKNTKINGERFLEFPRNSTREVKYVNIITQ